MRWCRSSVKENEGKMIIQFEKFTEKYIDEAVQLALAELCAERVNCPELPDYGVEGRVRDRGTDFSGM